MMPIIIKNPNLTSRADSRNGIERGSPYRDPNVPERIRQLRLREEAAVVEATALLAEIAEIQSDLWKLGIRSAHVTWRQKMAAWLARMTR